MNSPEPADAPVLCLMGPTASGKSSLAMALASELPIEIISVDSALVYRGMDIGTAKPTPADCAAVPHHLIDIVDPEESYSAARFSEDASVLLEGVRSRGKIPLLVGGTMLYYRALQHGLDAMPSADPKLRAKLEADAIQVGWPAMHQRLTAIDPVTAARLAPNDSQRIQRALEVFQSSGIVLSEWHRNSKARPRDATAWFNIALLPSIRKPLHERIAKRFDAMLEEGFLDEVQSLMQRPGFSREAPSMRAVGYRQAIEFLSGEVDQDSMRDRALAATRQLAKHQMTWLRSTDTGAIIDALAIDAREQFVSIAAQALTGRFSSPDSKQID